MSQDRFRLNPRVLYLNSGFTTDFENAAHAQFLDKTDTD